MGWYDFIMVREGKDFKVDIKYDYRGDYRGGIREYFREYKVIRWTQEELV